MQLPGSGSLGETLAVVLIQRIGHHGGVSLERGDFLRFPSTQCT